MSDRLRNIWRALFLAAILPAIARGASEPPRPPCASAAPSIRGLYVRATLPKAHYGPGEAIRVYLTFWNGSEGPVVIGGGIRPVAVVRVEGHDLTFRQGPLEWAVQSGRAACRIEPGKTLPASFELRPARAELTQGIYPMSVCCELDGAPPGALRGVLVSNEVELTIKYDVLIAY